MEFRIVIPARFGSTRLPGKALTDLAGKPMIQHVYERCVASGAETVVIATDDKRISDVAEEFGAQVCLTGEEHQTGTDRVAEAVNALEYDEDDIIVGVQCDEPLIPSDAIRQVASDLEEHDNIKVSSICEPIQSAEDIFDPNVVKVVLNHRNYAIYFSRAPIPWERETFQGEQSKIELQGQHFRHVGLYAYRVRFLLDYIDWSECPLETMEALEQLRILWHGGRIHMCISKKRLPPGVDTQKDLDKVLAHLKEKS